MIWQFDFVYDETLYSPVINEGNMEAKTIITVNFFDSTSYVEITSDQTSEKLRVDYSFVSGNKLVIDCDAQYVTIDGNNAMQYLDLTSRFFDLVVGSNEYTITPQRVGFTTVQYKERWR